MGSANYSKHAVRASLLHFLMGRSLAMVLGFALLLMLVRLLDAQSYGAYIALLSLLEMLQLVSSGGLILIAQRYIPELHSANQANPLRGLVIKLIVWRAVTLVVAAAICLPLAGLLASWFGIPGTETVFRFYGLVIIFEGMARFTEVCLDSLLKQKLSQLATLLRTALRVFLLGALAVTSETSTVSLQNWLWIDLIASACGCVFGLVSLLAYLRAQPDSAPLGAGTVDAKRVLRYVAPGFAAQVLYTSWGPDAVKLMGMRLAGSVAFAPFAFAMQLIAMLQRYLPVLLLMNLLRPLFVAARGRSDYRERLPFLAGLLVKLNFFMLAPALAFLLVLNQPTADWLTGGRFADAGGYLLVLGLVLVAQGARLTMGMVSQALEIGLATLLATAAGTLGFLLGCVMVPGFGLHSLALGLLLSELLCAACLAAFAARRGVRPGLDVMGLVRIVLCIAVAALVTLLVRHLLGAQALAVIVPAGFAAALVSFLAVARVARPFRQDERDAINALLNRRVFVW